MKTTMMTVKHHCSLNTCYNSVTAKSLHLGKCYKRKITSKLGAEHRPVEMRRILLEL